MDRLIYKEADGDLTCLSRDFDKVFPALYAYEETELTPEQIRGLLAQLEAVTEERDYLLQHIRETEGCFACRHKKKASSEPPCDTCTYDRHWEWTGMKED